MSMLGCFLAVTPSQLQGVRSDPRALLSLVAGEESGDHGFHVGQAWDGMHFLLTGLRCGERAEECPPLFGDREVPGSEYGYGGVLYLTAEQLREALTWMRARPPESLRSGYDAAALAKARVYPDIWERQDAVALDYLLQHYTALIAFYEKETAAGNAMLFYLG